jgi:hypothetical protein
MMPKAMLRGSVMKQKGKLQPPSGLVADAVRPLQVLEVGSEVCEAGGRDGGAV